MLILQQGLQTKVRILKTRRYFCKLMLNTCLLYFILLLFLLLVLFCLKTMWGQKVRLELTIKQSSFPPNCYSINSGSKTFYEPYPAGCPLTMLILQQGLQTKVHILKTRRYFCKLMLNTCLLYFILLLFLFAGAFLSKKQCEEKSYAWINH